MSKETKTQTVEVKKIVMELNGKEISLTLEEAEKFYKALGELFKEKVVTKEVEVVREFVYPRWYYTQPVYTSPKPSHPWLTPTYCKSDQSISMKLT